MAGVESIIIGKAAAPVVLDPRYANRHGLIAGATGTGKTVTLQAMTEGFSARGVPVFLVDVKGDLSGLCVAGEATGPFADRARQLGLGEYRPRAFRWYSGTCSANRATRFAPPSRRWGRCCGRGCWS